MISYAEYDITKVKPEDMLLFRQLEFMNRVEWNSKQPLWRTLLFMEKKIPIEYTMDYFKEMRK